MEADKTKLLKEITGARLSSVQFVLDYLILGFDQKGALTTLVWPELLIGGESFTFGAPGYRDRLCGLIPKVVLSVEVSDDERITISFEDTSSMVIALRTYNRSGERAIFTTRKRGLAVW
jgi:hypothetical protein